MVIHSQNRASEPHIIERFSLRLLLAKTLYGLESSIHKMRMVLQNERNCNVQNAAVLEIDSCDTILGYEIVDGREKLIWGKSPNMPWAKIG